MTRTRQLALDKDKQKLLELQRLQPVDGSRSWFVGNAVLQDGGVMVFSPVDALFVLLDAAWPQRARFSSVYDLLATAGNTWLRQLLTLRQVIECICDVQEMAGDKGVDNLYVKVNENKVTSWLRTKVERVANVLLKQEQDAAAKASTAAAFTDQVNVIGHSCVDKKIQAEKVQDEKADVARHYRHAIDVVGNYLADEWIDVLCSEFRVEREEEVKNVAKAAAGPMDTFQRFDRRRMPENAVKRPTSISAASVKKKSKLDNVDRSGMNSLTSFFSKK
uniref:Ribonuclease H2 subunit B wHTH domain-containing protein n=1 Tax=Hyaloperonospora arabidopsidis (strain Emoy2) TaxID=559515 RepID=M4BAN1_HYAAE